MLPSNTAFTTAGTTAIGFFHTVFSNYAQSLNIYPRQWLSIQPRSQNKTCNFTTLNETTSILVSFISDMTVPPSPPPPGGTGWNCGRPTNSVYLCGHLVQFSLKFNTCNATHHILFRLPINNKIRFLPYLKVPHSNLHSLCNT